MSGFSVTGRDLFGQPNKCENFGALVQRFHVPPFSVFNACQGYWQARKRMWLNIGLQSELGRGEHLVGSSSLYHGVNDKWGNRGPVRAIEKVESESGEETVVSEQPTSVRDPKSGKIVKSNGALKTNLLQIPTEIDRVTGKVVRSDKESSRGKRLTFVPGDRTPTDDTSKRIIEVAGTGTSIFDPVLCELMYTWFCPKNGIILDPFCGGSVRGIVASKLERRYWGCDLSKDQIEANKQQLGSICTEAEAARIRWNTGDSLEVMKKAPLADFIFSCPPYGDLEQYSDDPRDISSMSYEGFLGNYIQIIQTTCARLRENRFACFVVGNYRDKTTGIYRRLVDDTNSAFDSAGMGLYNDGILVTAVGSLPLRTAKAFEASRKLGHGHQYFLIFLKGDARLATAAIKESM